MMKAKQKKKIKLPFSKLLILSMTFLLLNKTLLLTRYIYKSFCLKFRSKENLFV